jgi:hypothetical protein
MIPCQGFCKVDHVSDRQRPEQIPLMIAVYYKIGLVYTNYTNDFHTTHQRLTASVSLKMVSAATRKQETNVFPNGHPLQIDLCYPDFIVEVMPRHHPLKDALSPTAS